MAPWELYEQPVAWYRTALAAMDAEARAQDIKDRQAARRKSRGG